MASHPSSVAQRRLARLARQRFVEGVCSGLPALDNAIFEFLIAQPDSAVASSDLHAKRDAWQLFQQHHNTWKMLTDKALREALSPHTSTRSAPALIEDDLQFELVSDDEVDNRITASRMALVISEHVLKSFDTVRARVQSLEGQELSSTDILRPEAVCQIVVEQWVESGLTRNELQMVLDPLQRLLASQLQQLYADANTFFDTEGVEAKNDLKSKVKRTEGGPATTTAPVTGTGPVDPLASMVTQALAQSREAAATQLAAAGSASQLAAGARARALFMQPTAFATAMSPMARARQRAQGVMGQLRRLLMQPAGGSFDLGNAPPASAALAQAMGAQQRAQADSYYGTGMAGGSAGSGATTMVMDYNSPTIVVQLAGQVRERSVELKKQAATTGEKAIIEVVALMFQSILAEDRIPPAVRVWFSRLQVPVLRVAMGEPEFFSNINHPARQLIDRMGACVMGFNSAAINGSALEAEIRRVVQVIEQYPETGRRVFQLVYDEFEKFLAKYLTEKQGTSRLVSVAQQVEQRETLAIQFTIELRDMLRDMPIREEIRDFLFKSWTEVLALAAVRDGAQHADTIALKRVAADLVWAASAKPNRADRAKVIQSLPNLLLRLRQGLDLLGVTGAEQDTRIKVLTDTLADAFMSKTESIPQERIDALAERLAHLEDFISDESLGDIELNTDNIEMMLGIDASSIHVVADNGAPVDPGMLAWAQELQIGEWYTLDHSGSASQVQYAWHSTRKQLHLFAAMDGSSYLIQVNRLAAYLQARLLVAQDEEGITLRATRDALAKLDANPERILD